MPTKANRSGSGASVMQMPIDFSVVARNGKTYDFHIPNNWFEKKTSATVLPRWIGFDELQRDYTAMVNIPSGIADVRIDTTYRLADAYQLNNSLRLPMDLTFDSHIYNWPSRKVYQGYVRPDLWYNGFDGTKVGVHFNGSYLEYKHKVWFTAWLNSGLGQNLPGGEVNTAYDPISFNFRYENGTERLLRGSACMWVPACWTDWSNTKAVSSGMCHGHAPACTRE